MHSYSAQTVSVRKKLNKKLGGKKITDGPDWCGSEHAFVCGCNMEAVAVSVQAGRRPRVPTPCVLHH